MKTPSIDISKLFHRKPLSTLDQIDFLKRLADLLAHGFTLSEAIHFLLQHLHIRRQETRQQLIQALQQGSGCATLLELLPYPQTIVMQVYFAELFGELNTCLISSIDYMERQRQAKQSLLKTLQYPIVLLSIFIVMLIVLNQTVIPEFQNLYETMDVNLSAFQKGLTQFIVLLPPSLFVTFIIGSCVTLLLIVFYQRLSPPSRIQFVLHVPCLKHYFKLLKTYRLATEFSLFYRNGISLNKIVEIYTSQAKDAYLNYLGHYILEHTEAGSPLGETLASLKCFESELITFIEQGQKKGKLDIELKLYSSILIAKIERKILKQLKFVQPIIFGLLAFLIVALYLVIMLPMFELMQTIK